MNAKTLKGHRAARGLTQTALARRAGLARVTIARLEGSRKWEPALRTVLALSKALGVPLAELLK